MGEKTLADRIYAMSEMTGIDTMDVMNTYINQESKMYARYVNKYHTFKVGGFEDEALKIMERYARIHYGEQ